VLVIRYWRRDNVESNVELISDKKTSKYIIERKIVKKFHNIVVVKNNKQSQLIPFIKYNKHKKSVFLISLHQNKELILLKNNLHKKQACFVFYNGKNINIFIFEIDTCDKENYNEEKMISLHFDKINNIAQNIENTKVMNAVSYREAFVPKLAYIQIGDDNTLHNQEFSNNKKEEKNNING